MIGAATLDPRQGERRQKALAAALAARARSSKMSRTARTGQGFGSRTGVGIRTAGGGGRPSGILNFISGKGVGAFNPGGFVNYFSPAANLATTPGDGGFVPTGGSGGFGGGSVPWGGPSMSPESDAALIAAEQTYGTPDSPSALSNATAESMNIGAAIPGVTPTSPVGGLVPLGGGVFLNPATGQLMGGGLDFGV